jgi:hypothetical protein
MKKIFLVLCVFFQSMVLLAQSPQSFKYQAVLRDKNGILLNEKNISVKISILQSTISGTTAYSETHAVKTNPSGIINIEIGKGNLPTGVFSSIKWGNDSYFVKVEIDQTGSGVFENIGISQLLSVPYALYAEKSGDEKWEKNSLNNIYFNTGGVGIGTTNPAYKLDVAGTINATNFLLNGQPLTQGPWTVGLNNTYYNSGFVGIGTSAPSVKLEIDGHGDLNLFNLKNDNNSLGINASVSSNTDFHGSALIGKRSRGSNASPTTVLAGDRITGIYSSLYANNNYQNAGAIHFYVGPNPGSSSYPVNIRFETTNTNETIRSERMRIAENGNVGIGTSNPLYKLDIAGTVNATNILVNGQPLTSGGSNPWSISANNLFYNSGNVGIGTNNPTVKLDIDGGGDTQVFNLRNDNNSLGINANVSSSTDFHGSAFVGKRSRGTFASPTMVAAGDRITGIYGSLFANGGYQNAGAIHMYVGEGPNSNSYPVNIRFETTNTNETTRTERMRVAENGIVKVSTNDVYISNIGSGVIMKSPNGQCWRMTVDNSGLSVFTAITCPN